MSNELEPFFTDRQLFVQQRKEWVEIVVDWETSNKYAILSADKSELGFIAERGGGFWTILKRWFLRSHRPLEIDVFNKAGQPLLHLTRNFFWFFSDLWVTTREGESLGSIHRRFGVIYKRYDLRDPSGATFATIASPIWRLWTFPIVHRMRSLASAPSAQISKKWGGALREIFTDADTYLIDFGAQEWSTAERAVILAAAISIDFDFFENNQGKSGGLVDLLPG